MKEIKALLSLENRPTTSECNTMSLSLFQAKVSYLERKIDFFTTAIQSLKKSII
ncbi:hypothetical protein ACERII_05235 [Evansella sp. AB-rgal1]|uniref:hypothetical protein n=1 Tax=Evansella sp. AB-rgal1 TaxID=3242696 RepID=UPI00359D771F